MRKRAEMSSKCGGLASLAIMFIMIGFLVYQLVQLFSFKVANSSYKMSMSS